MICAMEYNKSNKHKNITPVRRQQQKQALEVGLRQQKILSGIQSTGDFNNQFSLPSFIQIQIGDYQINICSGQLIIDRGWIFYQAVSMSVWFDAVLRILCLALKLESCSASDILKIYSINKVKSLITFQRQQNSCKFKNLKFLKHLMKTNQVRLEAQLAQKDKIINFLKTQFQQETGKQISVPLQLNTVIGVATPLEQIYQREPYSIEKQEKKQSFLEAVHNYNLPSVMALGGKKKGGPNQKIDLKKIPKALIKNFEFIQVIDLPNFKY